ncbi:MAG TPA: plastocyanin/azurin family copper-binding protein [Actinomycetes bacterium]|nr:plastocyanin/azurin family copper-binding protein [Actinomycetes bacterium]
MRPRPWHLTVVAVLTLAGGLALLRGGGEATPTVVVTMHHSRFQPKVVRVAPGTTVRFLLRNTDPIDHEFILGDDAVQRRHEQGREREHHGEVPGEVSVAAGGEAATTYTFRTGGPASLEFACHLPGHYAYGMRGVATVSRG